MAKEVMQQTRSLDGGGMFSTSQAADEELVESMAKRVVERLKEPSITTVRVGGWSGIGSKRVMDRVAAALLYDQNKEDFFCGVRVASKSYIPVEYEMRRKIEQVLQMSLLGGGDIFWREICMAMKWKPLVVILDNLQQELDARNLGIPAFVSDTQGAKHSFLKVVFTSYRSSGYEVRKNEKGRLGFITYEASTLIPKGVQAKVEDEFGDLPDDVALRMILYEAHSSATSTVKEYLPDLIRQKFESKKENMTSMVLPSLAPLHRDNFGRTLTAESVIQCLFSSILFTSSFPLHYLTSEILPHPCFDNINENSLEAKLLLTSLSRDLVDRHLVFLNGDEEKFVIFEHVYRKLAASASSSSSGIMTQFQGYLVRRSRRLEQVDMAEWSQDLTRISFADNWIKEVLLPPPSVPANFPNLSTLILQENRQLEKIPDDVFLYMPNLRILDLSYCSIGTLPSSLSSLWNLRTLYLQGCSKLQTIETTGLDNLEVLNLDSCPLVTLHKASWCHMRNLKFFRFWNGLRCLRELQLVLNNVKVFDKLYFSFSLDLHSLAPRVDTLQKCNIAILYPKEEEELRRRRTRDAYLLSSDQFPYKDIHAQVDRHIDTVEYPIVAAGGDNPHEKCLEINGGEGLWSLYTLSLMFRPRLLSLHNYQHAQAGIWPIPELKTCYIKYCSDMEYIFNSPHNEKDLWNLKYLETLWLSSLTKLSAICNNRFEQNESFLLLKSIYLEYCPNLLVLFPGTIRLPNLEVMEIKFCSRLCKLFIQHTAGEIVLPRLKRLQLCGLPKLTSICEEGHLPMLQKLEVRGCWNLKNVPIFPSSDTCNNDVAKVLVVRGEEGWWKNVQGFKDHIDFKIGFASAAPKHIRQRWKRGRRRRCPLSL